MFQPPFTQQDVEILGREPLYSGFFRMERVRFRHCLFAGGWSPVLTRELFVRGDAVALLPYDPVRDEVVLVEQFRIGAMEDSRSPWLLELVAGIIEAGETESDVARREAVEEAGLSVLRMEKLFRYHMSAGGSQELMHIYIGEVDASLASGLHGLAEEGEDIRVHRLSVAEAMEALNAGELSNSPVIMGLQWLALNRSALRKRWGQPDA